MSSSCAPSRAALSAAAVFFLSAAAPAALPPEEIIGSELASIYRVTPPRINPGSTSGLADRIEPVLLQQARYIISTLRPWDGPTSGAQLLTDGRSGEHGIRPNAHAAYGLAIMAAVVKPGSAPGPSAEENRERALALLRFLLPTHGAGEVPCSDGKLWHNQWQSALWANEAGKAAWFLWDHLSPAERWLAARMVSDEADRFLDVTPPSQIKRDTKSEENAWNSAVLSLAANMFPEHPRAPRWREAAIRWILNSYGREDDLTSTTLYDGRPLRDWLAGAVLHNDHSLENHNRVHPDYMGVTRATLIQRMVYDWAGTTVPQAFNYNVREVHAIVEKLAWPDGGVIYPNGQDWQIHRSPMFLAVHAAHALFFGDRTASSLLHMSLETIEKMAARERDWGIYLPEEFFFPSTQQYILQTLGETWLMLRQYGGGPPPVGEDKLWGDVLAGRHHFPSGEFAVLRSSRSAATFSWSGKVMGLVMPLEKDLLVTPNERGLVGTVRVGGESDDLPPRALRTVVASTSDTLQVAGILERSGGGVEQRFAFVALPDGRTVYADRLISQTTQPVDLHLGTVGVLNEPRWVYHDGHRTLHFSGSSHTFRADDPDTTRPTIVSSPWINLDDRLGVICLAGTGQQAYVPTTRWETGRVEQLLHLNYAGTVAAAPGKELTRTALVFYPSASTEATKERAQRCRLENPTPGTMVFTLEDGVRIRCDLESLQTQVDGR